MLVKSLTGIFECSIYNIHKDRQINISNIVIYQEIKKTLREREGVKKE